MKKQGSSLFREILDKAPGEKKRFIAHAMDISAAIQEVLESRGMSQRDLAQMLGKRDSEVTKWLSGSHNFTFKTIAMIEEALHARLISVRGVGGYGPLPEEEILMVADPAREQPPAGKPVAKKRRKS